MTLVKVAADLGPAGARHRSSDAWCNVKHQRPSCRPRARAAGTVTDFEVCEPGAECAAPTNAIPEGARVTVTATGCVTVFVAPWLSVTVSWTL